MPKNMFSNGTEYMRWQHDNCANCKKYENKSTDIRDAGCKAAFCIDLGSITGHWPKIIRKITGRDWKCKSIEPREDKQ